MKVHIQNNIDFLDGDAIGYMDWQYLYLLSEKAYERVASKCQKSGSPLMITKRELYKGLRQGGYVYADENGKTTRIKNINGKAMRLLWVPRND